MVQNGISKYDFINEKKSIYIPKRLYFNRNLSIGATVAWVDTACILELQGYTFLINYSQPFIYHKQGCVDQDSDPDPTLQVNRIWIWIRIHASNVKYQYGLRIRVELTGSNRQENQIRIRQPKTTRNPPNKNDLQ